MAKSKKAKARAKKVERNKNNKVDKTFDKHRKKARKEEIKYQKQMLRLDYPVVLDIERALLNESLAMPDRGGIPGKSVTVLQRAFKHGRVPWTKSEVEATDKMRRDAKEFIYRCREQAGVPVEDKGKYDGEMARTFSHQIIVDIRNGAYQKQKAAGHDKGDEKGEEQAEAGEEEAWGGVEDDILEDEGDEQERVEGTPLEQVGPEPVSPGPNKYWAGEGL